MFYCICCIHVRNLVFLMTAYSLPHPTANSQAYTVSSAPLFYLPDKITNDEIHYAPTLCRTWWPQALAQLSTRPSSSSHVPNGGADYITSEQRRDILELTGQFTARPYVAYQNCTHDERVTKVRQSYYTHVSCMSP